MFGGGYMAVYTYSYTYTLTNLFLHFKTFSCLPAVSPNSSSTPIYNKTSSRLQAVMYKVSYISNL